MYMPRRNMEKVKLVVYDALSVKILCIGELVGVNSRVLYVLQYCLKNHDLTY